MSADELRQAAETLRLRAERATNGPWRAVGPIGKTREIFGPPGSLPGQGREMPLAEQVFGRDSAYITPLLTGADLALTDALEAAIELDWCGDDWPEFGNLARLINEVGS